MTFKALLVLPFIFIGTCFAQPTQQQQIEDSVIGWQFMRSPAAILKPYNYKGHSFTIGQQEKMNTIIDWIQQTYTPVGGIGTFKRVIYAEEK